MKVTWNRKKFQWLRRVGSIVSYRVLKKIERNELPAITLLYTTGFFRVFDRNHTPPVLFHSTSLTLKVFALYVHCHNHVIKCFLPSRRSRVDYIYLLTLHTQLLKYYYYTLHVTYGKCHLNVNRKSHLTT